MPVRLIVAGASLGGLNAIGGFLDRLPNAFQQPIAIAQHRRAWTEDGLTLHLQRRCRLPVREVEDKEPIRAGSVYLAPAGYHLLVDRERFSLSTDPEEFNARPSIDVLFESAAETFGSELMAILFSGSNGDGANGIAMVHQCGGRTIVQDPATAEAAAMPHAAISTGAVDEILPLEEIAPYVIGACGVEGGR